MTKNQLEMRVFDLEGARDYWKRLYEEIEKEMEYQKHMKEETQRVLIEERKEAGKQAFTELRKAALDRLIDKIYSSNL